LKELGRARKEEFIKICCREGIQKELGPSQVQGESKTPGAGNSETSLIKTPFFKKKALGMTFERTAAMKDGWKQQSLNVQGGAIAGGTSFDIPIAEEGPPQSCKKERTTVHGLT